MNEDKEQSPNESSLINVKSDNEIVSTPEPLPVKDFNDEEDPES